MNAVAREKAKAKANAYRVTQLKNKMFYNKNFGKFGKSGRARARPVIDYAATKQLQYLIIKPILLKYLSYLININTSMKEINKVRARETARIKKLVPEVVQNTELQRVMKKNNENINRFGAVSNQISRYYNNFLKSTTVNNNFGQRRV
jgi:hypothetical protein